MKIVAATDHTKRSAAAGLALKLWPEHTRSEMEADLKGHCQAGGVVFLAQEESGFIGFAQCGLRHDYVEGTHTSPIGYLEGVYVEPAFRRCGVAAELLRACEEWAREQGCSEFASDAEAENVESIRFHLGTGFREVNRIVCFVKELKAMEEGEAASSCIHI